jgi:short-subunit dehydrogenase
MKPAPRVLLAAAVTASAIYLLRPRTPRPRPVVLITGGSRGLGLALAERFARSGALLVLAARDQEELERARHLLLERHAVATAQDVHLATADLNDPTQAAALIHTTLARFGRIDTLINNAGIMLAGPIEDQPRAAFERAMQTNFFAAVSTIEAALPAQLARFRATRQRSSIVNIASIGGKFAMPHMLPYVASKFALTGYSEGLHAELRHKGIRVLTVCPGLMRTGGHIQAQFTGQREKEYRWFALGATTPGLAASVTHAADKIYRAVQSGRAEITITPQAWLAARLQGLAPETTQRAAALVSQYLLPSSSGETDPARGASLRQPRIPLFAAGSASLQDQNNQS